MVDIQEWKLKIKEVVGWERKHKEIIGWGRKKEELRLQDAYDNKKLADLVLFEPVSVLVVYKDWYQAEYYMGRIGNKIRDKIRSEPRYNKEEVLFWGNYDLRVLLSNYKESVIRSATQDQYERTTKGTIIHFLLFTKDVEHDIKIDIVKNLFPQLIQHKNNVGDIHLEDYDRGKQEDLEMLRTIEEY